jgi:uncharacterized membrane protein
MTAVESGAITASSGVSSAVGAKAATRTRLQNIDALRGVIMLFMAVDHVRESFYAHHAVTDPMSALTMEPALFFTRVTSQFCAPIFVFLTGLSAYLYGQSHSKRETSAFLLKRGAFLVFLEFTLVGFAWAAQTFPPTFWLQVIWAIGLCMIVLAALIHLPRVWQVALGAAIVCGHNLLDPIVLTPDSPFYAIWGVLHQRALFHLGGGMVVKTSYPVLPWIGVILLGYAAGPWFGRDSDPATRRRALLGWGVALLVGFVALRFANVYGDKPWVHTGDALRSTMSFLALTKYPPSLLFLMPTIGIGLLVLVAFERLDGERPIAWLALLGGAPMFFYIVHLYVIKVLYWSAVGVFGLNHGAYFGFDNVATIWLAAALLSLAVYFPTRWFAEFKQRRRDLWWPRYF